MLKTLGIYATIEIVVLKILVNSGFMGLMNVIMNFSKDIIIVVGITMTFSVLFELIEKMKKTVEIETVSSLLYFPSIKIRTFCNCYYEIKLRRNEYVCIIHSNSSNFGSYCLDCFRSHLGCYCNRNGMLAIDISDCDFGNVA